LKNDVKVKWQYTGEVSNVQAFDVKFSQDLTHQNYQNGVIFERVI